MRQETDSHLLQRYADNKDEAAFAEVVRRNVNLVYSAALRLTGGNTTLAEEVAQSVFTELARQARILSARATLSGWLHTTTRYQSSKVRRGELRRKAREQEVFAMQNSTTPDINWEQVQPLLEDAVGRLAESERDVVMLRFFENKSYREVGDSVGVNEEAARKRVERALEKLRAYFSRRGVVISAGSLGEVIGANSVQAAPAGLAGALTGKALTGVAADTASGILLSSIFCMSTKAKLVVAVIVILAAAIPAYYCLVPTAESAVDVSLTRVVVPPQSPQPAVSENGTSTVVRMSVGNGVASPQPLAAPATSARTNATAIGAPMALGATALSALKTGLIAYKRRADLEKLDTGGLTQLKAWAINDPQAVINWLNDVPEDNKDHEHALEGMISILMVDSPQTALQMAKAINDPVVRNNREFGVLTSVALQNPTEAANMLNTSDWEEPDSLRTSVSVIITRIQAGALTEAERTRILQSLDK